MHQEGARTCLMWSSAASERTRWLEGNAYAIRHYKHGPQAADDSGLQNMIMQAQLFHYMTRTQLSSWQNGDITGQIAKQVRSRGRWIQCHSKKRSAAQRVEWECKRSSEEVTGRYGIAVIHVFVCSFAYLPIRPFVIPSLTQSPAHLLTHSLMHALTPSLTCSLTHSLTQSLTCSLTHTHSFSQ